MACLAGDELEISLPSITQIADMLESEKVRADVRPA
jgi:hypothetical protein